MEVQLFPNSRRPGVGLRPRRESQRPLLPQHARMCPVLEAGSAAGFLVFAPLAENEAFRIEYEGEGQYRFTFYVGAVGTNWQPIFSVKFSMPIGGVGSMREDVEFHVETPISPEGARKMSRIFIVPEDLGTPAGAVTLRGATNFHTPAGWDALYTSIFNNVERPVAPMLVVRVETDWFAHETEFRYVLQPGEAIHGAHSQPVGQVMFIPREEVTLRDCTPEELAAIDASKKKFFREKAGVTLRRAVRPAVQPSLRSQGPRRRAVAQVQRSAFAHSARACLLLIQVLVVMSRHSLEGVLERFGAPRVPTVRLVAVGDVLNRDALFLGQSVVFLGLAGWHTEIAVREQHQNRRFDTIHVVGCRARAPVLGRFDRIAEISSHALEHHAASASAFVELMQADDIGWAV